MDFTTNNLVHSPFCVSSLWSEIAHDIHTITKELEGKIYAQ